MKKNHTKLFLELSNKVFSLYIYIIFGWRGRAVPEYDVLIEERIRYLDEGVRKGDMA